MHSGEALEAHWVKKGRLSCDSDAPQVGSARSDWTGVAKVNRRKTNRRKTRPYCTSKRYVRKKSPLARNKTTEHTHRPLLSSHTILLEFNIQHGDSTVSSTDTCRYLQSWPSFGSPSAIFMLTSSRYRNWSLRILFPDSWIVSKRQEPNTRRHYFVSKKNKTLSYMTAKNLANPQIGFSPTMSGTSRA